MTNEKQANTQTGSELPDVSKKPREEVPMMVLPVTKMGKQKVVTIPTNIKGIQHGDKIVLFKLTDEYAREIRDLPRRMKMDVCQYINGRKTRSFY